MKLTKDVMRANAPLVLLLNLYSVYSVDVDYGVYFHTSGPYPGGKNNPMGDSYAPKSPKYWEDVDRVRTDTSKALLQCFVDSSAA